MKLDFRQRLLTTTLLVGTGMLASPAFAADQPAPTGQDQTTVPAAAAPPTGPQEAQPLPTTNAQGAPVTGRQEIVITGTRIPQPNLQSAAPISVVTNQDVKLSGTTRVEDVLSQLPSAAVDQSSGFSNGATGTAEVDLRYLGSRRTLTLVDGRRMALTPTRVAVTPHCTPCHTGNRAYQIHGGQNADSGQKPKHRVGNSYMLHGRLPMGVSAANHGD